MIKIRTRWTQEIFLGIQAVTFIFLVMQTQLGDYGNIAISLTLLTSCLGLFMVAFSIFRIPAEKKSKMILLSIFCLSLLSIGWIVISAFIQFIVESMP